jgi:glycosyltransferase involved in cell wall biosynthesis
MPEVAGDAALLVDPGNVDAIADGLVRLTTDPVLRDQLVTRGLERAKQFSWDRAVRETWAVYRELV